MAKQVEVTLVIDFLAWNPKIFLHVLSGIFALIGFRVNGQGCVSLAFKVASVALSFQTCLDYDEASKKVAVSRPPPVITEFWGKFVAKSDRDPEDPEHGAVYIFFDRENNLNRDASENCETSPVTQTLDDELQIRIRKIQDGHGKDFSVVCREPEKTS
jgi:hypothetical protein